MTGKDYERAFVNLQRSANQKLTINCHLSANHNGVILFVSDLK